VAVALDPTLVTLQTTRVEVETEGTWTRGETVTDLDDFRKGWWESDWPADDNARVAVAVDGDAFMDRFNDRLQHYLIAAARG
jgi:inosine-uridine nucleoside N-ribohydrolase